MSIVFAAKKKSQAQRPHQAAAFPEDLPGEQRRRRAPQGRRRQVGEEGLQVGRGQGRGVGAHAADAVHGPVKKTFKSRRTPAFFIYENH